VKTRPVSAKAAAAPTAAPASPAPTSAAVEYRREGAGVLVPSEFIEGLCAVAVKCDR
jgi:hypothetical protein